MLHIVIVKMKINVDSSPENSAVLYISSFLCFLCLFAPVREGLKKIGIHPYLGGWVGQDVDNIHKKQKNMPLKSILDHSKSF